MSSAQTIAEEDLRLGVAVRTPSIKVDGVELPSAASSLLLKVVVDSHLHLPDMFELTFLDQVGGVIDEAKFKLGAKVEVRALGGTAEASLMVGEVTSIEGRYSEYTWYTVIRGYSHDHRLQRSRRSRAFIDKTDSDVAKLVAEGAGLTVGTVTATTLKHPMLAQADQTDWSFLVQRAREIGYEVGAAEGKFYFRKASTLTGGTALPAAFGQGLMTFNPRVSAANLVSEVEARVQDTEQAKALAVTKPVVSPSADVAIAQPGAAASGFDPTGAPPPPPPNAENGPAPTAKGYVVNRGFSVTASGDQALQDTADALAAHVGSSFAEAEGELMGDARVIAGAVLQIDGVPKQFCGKWLVTTARHVFDNNDRGYRTRFTVSGRHDRSLLALTAGRSGRGSGGGGGSGVDGVVVGIVNDINDPLKLGRVTVILPWLAPDYVTGWAPVTQLFAGANGGAMFLPDVKEQVLVAFEQGDLRRPYVLGSVLNTRTGAGVKLDGAASKPGEAAVGGGTPAAVIRRGIVSPFGSQLVFHEEGPPTGGNPTAADVTLGAGKDKITILMDAAKGTLSIKCTPGSPPGAISIECDGNVDIKAGSSGTMTIDGGSQLTLKAQAVNIEGTGAVAVKGKPIQLN